MRAHSTSALLLSLALAGCATNDPGAPDANVTPTPPSPFDLDITPENVTLSFFEAPGVGVPPTTMGISPATLELMEDKPYLLVLTNDGQAPHNLVIEGLDVDTETFGPGETLEVELLPQERGEYVMYCAVGGDGPTGHRAQGMEGTVTVA